MQIWESFGNWFPRPRRTMPSPGKLPGVVSPECSCRGQCPSGLEELPRVLDRLEPWLSLPYPFIQLSLWLTFMEGLRVSCLLLTEEGTRQECGWRVSAGLGSVGNLGSVVCGSWNIPALRMSVPSQVSLMLRRQAQDAWNLPPGMAYKARAPSWGLFGGGGVYALWVGGVVSGRWGNKHPPWLSDCE